jgi:TatD DNase family protein
MSALYDSHCHLDAPEFDPDREAVLARARAAGVTAQLVPAVERAAWEKLRDLCAADPGLRPAYGLHPMYLDRHRPDHLDELADWLARERPAAVGECGLDFFVEGLDPEAQRFYFHGQLALARQHDLPLVLHARRAVDEVIAALRRIGGLRGVVHSWSGSPEQAAQLFGLGFHLGIGGPVTFERAQRLRRTVATMPRTAASATSPDGWARSCASSPPCAARIRPRSPPPPAPMPSACSALAEILRISRA